MIHVFDGLDLYPWHIAFRNNAMFLATLGHSHVGLATECLARAGVGEEVTHINSNNNCLNNLRNLRDLGLIGAQHGSNEVKNI